MIPQKKVSILLHNIRSVHNTASIFRTADCAGMSKIYLSGHTPAPLDRFKRKRNDFAKVALGAEESVTWEYFADAHDAIAKFKNETGGIVIAVEQDKKSVDYRNFAKNTKQNQSILLVMGNEVEGIEQGILDIVDSIIEIPQFGTKESLNVSVAAGIVIFSFVQ